MDALRYAMKHVQPEIGVDETFEAVRPRIEGLPEFQAIEDEQARIDAFEKYMKRLKVRHKHCVCESGVVHP